MSHEERAAFVERENGELPLTQQAELLSISRSSLSYQPREPSMEEIAIKHRIDEIYTQYPLRKIEAQLRREGILMSRKTVQRQMREMGIVAIYPGPKRLIFTKFYVKIALVITYRSKPTLKTSLCKGTLQGSSEVRCDCSIEEFLYMPDGKT